jgi:hypothetical protein
VTRRGYSGETAERVKAAEVSRLLVVARPWTVLVLVLAAGAGLRAGWGGWPAAAALAAGGPLTGWWAAHLTRSRRGASRWLAPGSAVAVFWWLAWTVGAGLGRWPAGAWAVGGSMLALAWSLHGHIGAGEPGGAIGHIFGHAAVSAGYAPMKVIKAVISDRAAEGTVAMQPGDTASDAQKTVLALESASGLPPGSIQVSQDEDHAGRATYRLSDPRILKRPQPWPGPSAPGASIAQPIRPSVYQDGTPLRYVVVNHHLKLAGTTGSGKSFGWCWCEVAETVTRTDAAVLMIDVVKGRQTVGPLEPALHRCATTADSARQLLEAVHAAIRPRTDHLAARGLGRWEEGCGLTHLTVWVEEGPDVFELLDDAGLLEMWISDVRTARSAGIRFVISMQRPDWTQMPVTARGQMGHACFGLAQPGDAPFGLSAYQHDAGCQPELWADSHPGMHFLDTGQIPASRKAMPLRTWYWGATSDLITAHCAEWPASGRPLDPVTAAAFAPAAPAAPLRRESATLRPAPAPADDDLDDDDLDDEGDDDMDTDAPIEYDENSEFGRFQFGGPAGPRLDSGAARAAFRAQLDTWRAAGRDSFAAADLAAVLEATGRSRPWLYDVLAELEAEGVITRRTTGYPVAWLIRGAA